MELVNDYPAVGQYPPPVFAALSFADIFTGGTPGDNLSVYLGGTVYDAVVNTVEFEIAAGDTSIIATAVGFAANATDSSFAADLDVGFELQVKPPDGNFIGLFFRAQGTADIATTDGYFFALSAQAGTDVVIVQRVINASFGKVVCEVVREGAAGDVYGVRAIGSTFQMYVFPAGGAAWEAIGNGGSDSMFLGSGKIMFFADNNVGEIGGLFVYEIPAA